MFYDVHFILKDETDKVSESDVELYISDNYEKFTNVCMAKIALLIAQITSQVGKGMPIVSSPYFTREIKD